MNNNSWLPIIIVAACVLFAINGGTVGGGPAPIASTGYSCLLVEDQSARGNLTATQQEILLSTLAGSVQDYNNTHAVKDSKGQPAWKLLDQNDKLDPTQIDPMWVTAMARPRASVPWYTVSNGKSGEENPIPPTMTAAQFKTILQKYGGP